jgi:cytochrome c-type biogenesis protein CcmH
MSLMLNRSIVHISMAALLLFASLLLALALAPAVGAQSPPGSFSEEEAQAIDRMIMCPVCPAETIDQAQVEVSFQMRALVRQLLAEGRSRDEILEYFADRYGADILAAPPKSGANLLVWILPIVGVAAGLAGVYLVVRAMTNRAQPAAAGAMTGPAADPATDPGLRPYLQIVDRSLASRRAARTPSGRPATGAPESQTEEPEGPA